LHGVLLENFEWRISPGDSVHLHSEGCNYLREGSDEASALCGMQE
jgi:hypothetical protein